MRGPAWVVLLAATAALAAQPSAAVAGPTAYDVGAVLGAPHPLSARPRTAPAKPPGVASGPPISAQPEREQTVSAPAEATTPPATPPVPVPFAAARDRWYVAGSLGLAIPRRGDVSGGLEATLDFANRATFAGTAGYAWRSGFRAEGQVWYQTFAVDDIQISDAGTIPGLNPGAGGASGDARAVVLTANLAYDFETNSRWSPYFIGGIGIANVIYDDIALGGVTMIDDNAWMLAFQVGTGISYLFSAHWSAEAAYRYIFTLDPNMADATGRAIQTDFATHNIVFGARYAF